MVALAICRVRRDAHRDTRSVASCDVKTALEDDIRAVLEVIALPEGFVEEVAQAEAEGTSSRADREPSAASIDGRLARVREQLISSVLERVVVQADGALELVPREGWKSFVRQAIGTVRLLPARGGGTT